MTFEFDYNMDTDQIKIVYDGAWVLTAEFDGETVCYHNFDKIEDDTFAKILKNLCKETFKALA